MSLVSLALKAREYLQTNNPGPVMAEPRRKGP